MRKSGENPRVLVVIPTLGQRIEYLRMALESVAAQAGVRADIVIVYPLTNSAVSELAREFGASSIDDPGGMSAALNLGIASAKPWHDYIVWIGDDDLLLPGCLETSLTALDSQPGAVLAFGYCDYIDENGRRIFTSRAGNLAPWIMTWGPDLVPMMGLMMRKASLDAVGPFDTVLKTAMDLDLLLRLRRIGPFINTKTVLSAFRWHTASQTVANRPAVLAETELIKRRYLSAPAKRVAFLWEKPVRVATKLAVRRVNAMAKKRLAAISHGQ